MKVRILSFLTTFTQLTARLKNFVMGWLLILGLKEGLVESAIVCAKSEVILTYPLLLSEFEICKSYDPTVKSLELELQSPILPYLIIHFLYEFKKITWKFKGQFSDNWFDPDNRPSF